MKHRQTETPPVLVLCTGVVIPFGVFWLGWSSVRPLFFAPGRQVQMNTQPQQGDSRPPPTFILPPAPSSAPSAASPSPHQNRPLTFEESVERFGKPAQLPPVVPDDHIIEPFDIERTKPVRLLSMTFPTCKPTGYRGVISLREMKAYLAGEYRPAVYTMPYCKFPAQKGQEQNPVWLYRDAQDFYTVWVVYFKDGYPARLDKGEIPRGES